MGLGALAIYNESEEARKAVDYAKKYISEFLNHVYLEDGGGHEGIMYSRYGQLFSLYFKRLINSNFLKNNLIVVQDGNQYQKIYSVL